MPCLAPAPGARECAHDGPEERRHRTRQPHGRRPAARRDRPVLRRTTHSRARRPGGGRIRSRGHRPHLARGARADPDASQDRHRTRRWRELRGQPARFGSSPGSRRRGRPRRGRASPARRIQASGNQALGRAHRARLLHADQEPYPRRRRPHASTADRPRRPGRSRRRPAAHDPRRVAPHATPRAERHRRAARRRLRLRCSDAVDARGNRRLARPARSRRLADARDRLLWFYRLHAEPGRARARPGPRAAVLTRGVEAGERIGRRPEDET